MGADFVVSWGTFPHSPRAAARKRTTGREAGQAAVVEVGAGAGVSSGFGHVVEVVAEDGRVGRKGRVVVVVMAFLPRVVVTLSFEHSFEPGEVWSCWWCVGV